MLGGLGGMVVRAPPSKSGAGCSSRLVDCMAAKSAKPSKPWEPTEYFTYCPGDIERRTLAPWEVQRRPWGEGEQVRAFGPEVDTDRPTALVWVEDREHPGLVFRFELDRAGQMVGFAVRPLAFVRGFRPDGTAVPFSTEVDDEGHVDGAPRLSAALLQRGIKIGRLHQAATTCLRRYGRVLPIAATPVARGEPTQRVRPSELTDETLARFAAECVALVERGYGGDVTKRLAISQHLSEGGVVYRVRTARQRGLLTATTRGRSGGSLTSKARALL